MTSLADLEHTTTGHYKRSVNVDGRIMLLNTY